MKATPVIGAVFQCDGGFYWRIALGCYTLKRTYGWVYTTPQGAGRAMIKAAKLCGIEIDEFFGCWEGPKR